jgi:predicted branched-subunit amino acid permease
MRQSFLAGVRVGSGPAVVVFLLALSFGATASIAGWGVAAPIVFSLLAFSGAAQFTLLTAFGSGGALAAITAAALINGRYVVMSVALNESLRGGRWWRAAQSQALVDASFVVAYRGSGRFDVAKMVGASVPQWVGWVSGTVLGVLTHPDLGRLHDLGADVAFPAFFLMLALQEVRRSRSALLGAVVGGLIAGGLLAVTAPGVALLGATAGALIGAWREGDEDHPRDTEPGSETS